MDETLWREYCGTIKKFRDEFTMRNRIQVVDGGGDSGSGSGAAGAGPGGGFGHGGRFGPGGDGPEPSSEVGRGGRGEHGKRRAVCVGGGWEEVLGDSARPQRQRQRQQHTAVRGAPPTPAKPCSLYPMHPCASRLAPMLTVLLYDVRQGAGFGGSRDRDLRGRRWAGRP